MDFIKRYWIYSFVLLFSFFLGGDLTHNDWPAVVLDAVMVAVFFTLHWQHIDRLNTHE